MPIPTFCCFRFLLGGLGVRLLRLVFAFLASAFSSAIFRGSNASLHLSTAGPGVVEDGVASILANLLVGEDTFAFPVASFSRVK